MADYQQDGSGHPDQSLAWEPSQGTEQPPDPYRDAENLAQTGEHSDYGEASEQSESSEEFDDVALASSGEWESSSHGSIHGTDTTDSSDAISDSDFNTRVLTFIEAISADGEYGHVTLHGIFLLNVLYSFFLVGGGKGVMMKTIFALFYSVPAAYISSDFCGFDYNETYNYYADNIAISLLSQVASDGWEIYKRRCMFWMKPLGRGWRVLRFVNGFAMGLIIMLAWAKFFWCRNGRWAVLGGIVTWGSGTG